MADTDLGDIVTDIFNAEEVKLGYQDGSDTKFFSSIQEIKEHWERHEIIVETRTGTAFIYSKNHNNYVDFKMAITRKELKLLHDINQSLTKKTWVITGKDESSNSTNTTLTFDGKIPIIDKESIVKGYHIVRCRIRVVQNQVLIT